MLKKNKATEDMQTVIGKGMTVEAAKITGGGQLKIEGKIVGDIELDGVLTVSETGYVFGNIWVKDLFVAGGVKGDLHSEGKAHLACTAKVYGGLESSYIVMEKGVIFEGACRTLRTEPICANGIEGGNENREDTIAYFSSTDNT